MALCQYTLLPIDFANQTGLLLVDLHTHHISQPDNVIDLFNLQLFISEVTIPTLDLTTCCYMVTNLTSLCFFRTHLSELVIYHVINITSSLLGLASYSSALLCSYPSLVVFDSILSAHPVGHHSIVLRNSAPRPSLRVLCTVVLTCLHST